MEKMKKLLERKGTILVACIIVLVVDRILEWIFLIRYWIASDAGAAGEKIPMFVIAFGYVTTVVVILYFAYRLLYLYRGTKKRALWTALTIATIVIAYVPSDGGLTFLGFVGSVITLCCWIHDIGIVLDVDKAEKKAEPE